MANTTTYSGTFGSKLAGVLESRKMGARTLAKLIAREHGGSVDDRRRTIIRWLRGATPMKPNRHIVEDVLGVPRDSLKGDDEAEEEDLAVPFLSIDLDLLVRAIEARLRANGAPPPVPAGDNPLFPAGTPPLARSTAR